MSNLYPFSEKLIINEPFSPYNALVLSLNIVMDFSHLFLWSSYSRLIFWFNILLFSLSFSVCIWIFSYAIIASFNLFISDLNSEISVWIILKSSNVLWVFNIFISFDLCLSYSSINFSLWLILSFSWMISTSKNSFLLLIRFLWNSFTSINDFLAEGLKTESISEYNLFKAFSLGFFSILIDSI